MNTEQPFNPVRLLYAGVGHDSKVKVARSSERGGSFHLLRYLIYTCGIHRQPWAGVLIAAQHLHQKEGSGVQETGEHPHLLVDAQ